MCLLLVSVCAFQWILLWFCLCVCLCMCPVSSPLAEFWTQKTEDGSLSLSLYLSLFISLSLTHTHALALSHVACLMGSQDFHSHGPRAENIKRTDVLGCPRILTLIDAHALSKETYLCRKRPSTVKSDLIGVVILTPIDAHALSPAPNDTHWPCVCHTTHSQENEGIENVGRRTQ